MPRLTFPMRTPPTAALISSRRAIRWAANRARISGVVTIKCDVTEYYLFRVILRLIREEAFRGAPEFGRRPWRRRYVGATEGGFQSKNQGIKLTTLVLDN